MSVDIHPFLFRLPLVFAPFLPASEILAAVRILDPMIRAISTRAGIVFPNAFVNVVVGGLVEFLYGSHGSLGL